MAERQPTPTRGVPVMLDKVRHLRYPIKVLERMAGEELPLSKVLFYGLQHEDPELTVERVGEELIDLEMLPDLKSALRQATGGLIDLDKLFGPLWGDGNPPQMAKESGDTAAE